MIPFPPGDSVARSDGVTPLPPGDCVLEQSAERRRAGETGQQHRRTLEERPDVPSGELLDGGREEEGSSRTGDGGQRVRGLLQDGRWRTEG